MANKDLDVFSEGTRDISRDGHSGIARETMIGRSECWISDGMNSVGGGSFVKSGGEDTSGISDGGTQVISRRPTFTREGWGGLKVG